MTTKKIRCEKHKTDTLAREVPAHFWECLSTTLLVRSNVVGGIATETSSPTSTASAASAATPSNAPEPYRLAPLPPPLAALLALDSFSASAFSTFLRASPPTRFRGDFHIRKTCKPVEEENSDYTLPMLWGASGSLPDISKRFSPKTTNQMACSLSSSHV